MPERLPLEPGRLRLLLVDENPALSQVLARALADRFHVVSVRSGAEARRKVHAFRPDMIVLELMLPDVDGLLLMVQLKAATDAVNIVCTSRTDPVDRALSTRLGAVDFIPKPITVKEFKARLTEILSASR
jgi:DNA-binding response OmpR family regulator